MIDCRGYSEVIVSIIITRRTRYKRLAAGQHGPGQLTDSIQPTDAVKSAKNIRIVPTAPVFAQAILNIWHGTSVSSLFDAETLSPIYDGVYAAE